MQNDNSIAANGLGEMATAGIACSIIFSGSLATSRGQRGSYGQDGVAGLAPGAGRAGSCAQGQIRALRLKRCHDYGFLFGVWNSAGIAGNDHWSARSLEPRGSSRILAPGLSDFDRRNASSNYAQEPGENNHRSLGDTIGILAVAYLLSQLHVIPEIPHFDALLPDDEATIGFYEGYVRMALPGVNSLSFLVPFLMATIVIRSSSRSVQSSSKFWIWIALLLSMFVVIVSGRRATTLALFLTPVLIFAFGFFGAVGRTQRSDEIASDV